MRSLKNSEWSWWVFSNVHASFWWPHLFQIADESERNGESPTCPFWMRVHGALAGVLSCSLSEHAMHRTKDSYKERSLLTVAHVAVVRIKCMLLMLCECNWPCCDETRQREPQALEGSTQQRWCDVCNTRSRYPSLSPCFWVLVVFWLKLCTRSSVVRNLYFFVWLAWVLLF